MFPSAVFFDFGKKKGDVQLFNLHCKLETGNELVCFVDVLNWESKSASDYENQHGAHFCGAWKVEHNGERDVLNSHITPDGVACSASTACRSVKHDAVVTAVYHRHKDVCAANGEKSSEEHQTEVYALRYETESTDEIKMTTDMFTNTGFVTVRLGKAPIEEPPKRKSDDTKYYLSVSGGGWRALSSSIGALRGLSTTNALSNVDMFSSVSGGSWFLTKLTFDDEFASEVLGTDVPIGHVITKWYDTQYFPGVNSGNQKPCTDDISRFLSAMSSGQTAIAPEDLGDMIGNYEHFGYDWGKLVHEFILGKKTSGKSLHTAKVAPFLRAKIPQQVKFAFNWNHFNHWGDDTRRYFLRDKKAGQMSQYPVYTNAHYDLNGEESKVEVKARGWPMNDQFEVCHVEKNGQHICGDHDFSNLTVGQAASASSAYPGYLTVQSWMQSIFTQLRAKVGSMLTTTGLTGYLTCGFLRKVAGLFLKGHCNEDAQTEIAKIIGCRSETLEETTARWTKFMTNMAIDFTRRVKDSGELDTTKMAFDALNDVSGLGTILAEHLKTNQAGQALLIVNNGLGTNYMERFFKDGPLQVGEHCEPGMTGEDVHEAYKEIIHIHEQSYKVFGAEFKRNEEHPICAVPLADNTFFEGAPPQQYRFDDPFIPKHITYAYKKSAKIIRNDEFYYLKEGQDSEIDVLFLILNGPLATFPNPKDGSLGHVGVAVGMEQAINALQKDFPSFFPDK